MYPIISDILNFAHIYIHLYYIYINIYYYTYVTHIYIYTIYTGQWILGTPSSRTSHGSLCEALTNPDPAEDARDRHLPAPPPPLSTLRQWDLLILNSYGPMAIWLLLGYSQSNGNLRKGWMSKIEVILWWRQIWADNLCGVSTSTLAVRGRLQATLRRTSPTGPPRGRLTSMSCSSSSHILDSRVGLSWKYCKLSQY